jgi:xylulokinase
MGAGPPEFDPHARGVIFGLTLSHKRAHVIRAILESIAFMLRRNVELIEELGIEVKEIRSLGGGSRSTLWNQIKADVTSKVVSTLHTEEAASLGVAILAGAADGLFKSIEEGCKAMVHLKDKYNLRSENREVYDKLYKIYSTLYDKLKDAFLALNVSLSVFS